MDSTFTETAPKLSGATPAAATSEANESTADFVDSYQAFTNVINGLRRQYLDLKDESQRQAEALAAANESLQSLTRRNQAAMEFLHCVLGSVSAGIIVADRDQKITHLNPAAEALFSVEASQSLGLSLEAITKFESSVASAGNGSNTESDLTPGRNGNSEGHIRGVERSIRMKNGEDRTYLWGSSPLLDKQGHSFGSVEAFQDITYTKRMELKVTRMEALAAIGEMAATVAHQVRNPLVGVKGFASLISATPAKGTKNKAHAELILRGVDNLERVIDTLLRFSRTETLTLRSINLNRYLKKIVRQFNERLELTSPEPGSAGLGNIGSAGDGRGESQGDSKGENRFATIEAVNITVSERKIAVDIDQLALREAIVNILRNAQEAADSSVSCEILVEDCSAGATFAYFQIRDSGPGMAPATSKDIFRPFFTTKASGSGLGLPLARKLINAHGGEITVESTLGVGTTFRIKLPLSNSGQDNSVKASTDSIGV